jgi:hypothetical protein
VGYAKIFWFFMFFEEIFEMSGLKTKKINSLKLSKDLNVFVETHLEPLMVWRVVLV